MVETLTPLAKWADKIGLEYQSAYRLCRQREINAIQLGTRWYVVNGGVDLTDSDDRSEEDGGTYE